MIAGERYMVYKNGWSESDYFYPVLFNPRKKLAGKFYDSGFNLICGKGIAGKHGEPSKISCQF